MRMTFEQWMQQYLSTWSVSTGTMDESPDKVLAGVGTTVYDRSAYSFRGRGQYDVDFQTEWHHPVGEAPDWPYVLDSLRGDVAALDDGFANWEHGFDDEAQALKAFDEAIEKRAQLRRALGWVAYMDLFDCEAV